MTTTFIIYAVTGQGFKKELKRFWNGRKAFDFCNNLGWQWTDPETGFVYDLGIEDEEE